MIDRITGYFSGLRHQRALHFIERAMHRAADAPVRELKTLRSRAGQIRRRIDKLTHIADGRLAQPMIGANAIRKPPQSDFAYRPEIWRGPLRRVGRAAVESHTKLGQEATIFHDCKVSEITVRQVRNTRPQDLAPFGVRIDVFNFDGSFLSLALDLPGDLTTGLKKSHLIQVDAVIESEKPLEIFARLNLKHGPNTEQVVREFDKALDQTQAEFDLAYTEFNERRSERAWLDLIFEGPAFNQILLRDLTISRRPRALI